MHTPEPWLIHGLNGRLPKVMRRKMPHGEADTFFTSIHGPDKMRVVELDWGYGRKTDEANAVRIVESVNALAGIPNPAALRSLLNELRTAPDQAAVFAVHKKILAMVPEDGQ